MNSNSYQRVKEVFFAVQQCASHDRGAVLQRECGDDVPLRREVESLLAHSDASLRFELTPQQVADFLNSSAAAVTFAEVNCVEQIGEFRVLHVLGEGGMGVVYLAEQELPKRTVAVKVMRTGLVSSSALNRFEREMLALGRLQHPGIAQIYAAGTGPLRFRGAQDAHAVVPYFAMEYIRGASLIDHAHAHSLNTLDRLALLASVCDAVHYAHTQGIVHRDLKPTNVLVDQYGQPKILDFGIAQMTDADVQVTTIQTDVAQLVGTLPYMSPEQASGGAAPIDRRSDIYTLGVIGFELLTGCLPYNVRSTTLAEALRVIMDADPDALGAFNRSFRGDLETVIGKALEKEPARRYASAFDLAEDLRRYLRHEPIIARPQTASYQLKKFVKRNRIFVGALGAVFFTLLLSLALISIYAYQATVARNAAVLTQRELEKKSKESQQQALLARQQAYRATMASVDAALHVNDVAAARVALDQIDIPDRSHWEWRYYNNEIEDSAAIVRTSGQTFYSVAFAPDSKRFVTASLNKKVDIWNVGDSQPSLSFDGHSGAVHCAVFSPDGERIASCSADQTVRIWDSHSGEILHVVDNLPARAIHLQFSHDGTAIAAACGDGTVRILNGTDGAPQRIDAGHTSQVNRVAIHPDDSVLASVSNDNTVRVRDLRDGRELAVLSMHNASVIAAAFSSDGRWLATAGEDAVIWLTDASTWRPFGCMTSHRGSVTSLCFSPDSQLLASGSIDATVRVWRVANLKEIQVLTGHALQIHCVAWADDGQHMASTSTDGTVRFWNPEFASEPRFSGHRSPVQSLVVSHNSQNIISSAFDGSIRVWDFASRHQVALIDAPAVANVPLALSMDGRLLASVGEQNSVVIRETATFKVLKTLAGHRSAIISISFSPDGRSCAVGGADSTITIWDLQTDEIRNALSGHAARVCSVLFTRDSRRLISACNAGRVRTWDLDDGSLVRENIVGGKFLCAATLSPDGTILVTGAANGQARFWNVADGTEIGPDIMCPASVHDLAFSPDGHRLALGLGDGSIRLYDTTSHAQVAVLRGNRSRITTVRFSPNGDWLLSTCQDNVIRLWCATRVDKAPSIDAPRIEK